MQIILLLVIDFIVADAFMRYLIQESSLLGNKVILNTSALYYQQTYLQLIVEERWFYDLLLKC